MKEKNNFKIREIGSNYRVLFCIGWSEKVSLILCPLCRYLKGVREKPATCLRKKFSEEREQQAQFKRPDVRVSLENMRNN